MTTTRPRRHNPGAIAFYLVGITAVAAGVTGAMEYGVDERTLVWAFFAFMWVAGGEIAYRIGVLD